MDSERQEGLGANVWEDKYGYAHARVIALVVPPCCIGG